MRHRIQVAPFPLEMLWRRPHSVLPPHLSLNNFFLDPARIENDRDPCVADGGNRTGGETCDHDSRILASGASSVPERAAEGNERVVGSSGRTSDEDRNIKSPNASPSNSSSSSSSREIKTLEVEQSAPNNRTSRETRVQGDEGGGRQIPDSGGGGKENDGISARGSALSDGGLGRLALSSHIKSEENRREFFQVYRRMARQVGRYALYVLLQRKKRKKLSAPRNNSTLPGALH